MIGVGRQPSPSSFSFKLLCDVSGYKKVNEVLERLILRCIECGKTYCEKCAEKDGTVKELGVCSDCEEVYEAEEDYYGWK